VLATERILCAVNMWDRGFEEHVAAAAAAGWDGISVIYRAYRRAREQDGLTDADMRAILGHHGVHVDEIEVCHEWIYGTGPEQALGQAAPARTCGCGLCAPVDDMIAMAVALGARTIIATHRIEPVPPAVAAERLARFCDQAGEHGLRVAIEYIPYSPFRTVTGTWNVIEASGRDNAGLCLDTHHHRCLGGGDEGLAGIPADRVFILQVTDGVPLPPDAPRADIFTAMTSRRTGFAPGEGELDIAATLAALERMGVRTPVGVEVRKPEWAGRPAADVAAELRQIMDGFLAAADAAPRAG
jgi:sugar phosphate isomerase/epimerase